MNLYKILRMALVETQRRIFIKQKETSVFLFILVGEICIGSILSLMISLLDSYKLITLLLISYILTLYNHPMIYFFYVRENSLCYKCDSKIKLLYSFYIYVRENILFVVLISFLLSNLLFSFSLNAFITLIYTVLWYLSIFVKDNRYKLVTYTYFLITICVPETSLALLSLLILGIFTVYFGILSFINDKHKEIYILKKYRFRFNILRLIQDLSFKELIFYLGILLLVTIIKMKLPSLFIDIALICSMVFEYELIMDKHFSEIDKHLSHFFVLYHAPIQILKRFYYSSFIMPFFVYGFILIFTSIITNSVNVLSLIYVFVLLIISGIYYLYYERMMLKQKKSNNYVIQFISMSLIGVLIVIRYML